MLGGKMLAHMTIGRLKSFLVLTTIAVMPMASEAATVPDAQAPSSTQQTSEEHRVVALEEIIVTAQKREENFQAVPLSITAFDAESLARIGFSGVTTLGDKVPALDLQPYPNSTSTLKIYMRGVGQEEPEEIMRDQGVGIYLEDVYVAHGSALSAELADTERVEVLSGPQGTLY